MALRQIRVNGRKVWQARVAFNGARRSTIKPTREEARTAEGDILRALKAEAGQAEREAEAPATLRQLLEFYALDMQARGRGEESVERVEYTRRSIEAVVPAMLDRAVSTIGDADVFAFRNARAREGKAITVLVGDVKHQKRVPAKASTINRDLRTLRAALKKGRPEYRFPGGAFFKEDETRVRWLRPEEELLVLGTMASPFREIAQVAALTLMRMTEIRRLDARTSISSKASSCSPRRRRAPGP
jgi:hypothetical protein